MARRKTKMRTGKVKRVKKTRNSRRTKRNTRRRNKRGGDLKGSLKFITELGKGVSGAVGRSLKERYNKYLKRKTDKGIEQPLLNIENKKTEKEKIEEEANGLVTLDFLKEKARGKAREKKEESIRIAKANFNYVGGKVFSDYDNALRHDKNHYKNIENNEYKNELKRLQGLFPNL